MFILLFLFTCLTSQQIKEQAFWWNKKQPTPPPQPECVDPPDDDFDPPKEFVLRSGSLYRITSSDWYLRVMDQGSKQTVLVNLKDVKHINTNLKEIDVEIQDEKKKQKQAFVNNQWTPILALQAFPSRRGGHSMHNIGEYILLFGGCFLEIKCFNDLYLFNVRTKIWTNPKVFGTPPSGRTGFGAMVNGGRFYVFGGHTISGLVNDLFEFDLESRSWNELQWFGQRPTPRANHKMVLTSVGGIIFGGYVGETYANDIYILDLVNERWGKPTAGGDIPQGRESFGMVYHHNKVFVFGGYSEGVLRNDMYVLDEDLIWTEKKISGKIPSQRQGISMTEYDDRVFLAGGCNPYELKCFNDLYTFDVNSCEFTEVSTQRQSNLRKIQYGAMVISQGMLIHFGGCDLNRICSDSLTGLKITDPKSCPPCKNGAECRAGFCHCPPGYQGIDCTLPVFCRQNCLNQGSCLSNGNCKCYPGYTGTFCQILIPCQSNCTDIDHGICQLDGTCECKEGFTGSDCNSKNEEPPLDVECFCHAHGECNPDTLLCACDEGFYGPDCTIVDGMVVENQYDTLMEMLKDEEEGESLEQAEEHDLELMANAYKFHQRQEGPVPIFENDIDKVYYEDVIEDTDADNNNEDQQQSYSHHSHHKYAQSEQNVNLNQQHQQQNQEFQQQTQSTQSRQFRSLFPLQIQQQQQNGIFVQAPPKSKKKDEDPYELQPLDECPKHCSHHGVCIENTCYCWYGYTGDHCQASKIRDFYIGVRKKNVLILCIIFLILGIITGYIVVLFIQKRGVEDEFKNVSEIQSGQVEDNEGEVEELLL